MDLTATAREQDKPTARGNRRRGASLIQITFEKRLKDKAGGVMAPVVVCAERVETRLWFLNRSILSKYYWISQTLLLGQGQRNNLWLKGELSNLIYIYIRIRGAVWKTPAAVADALSRLQGGAARRRFQNRTPTPSVDRVGVDLGEIRVQATKVNIVHLRILAHIELIRGRSKIGPKFPFKAHVLASVDT